MTHTTYDVTAVGNAIVDILATSDDKFITEHGLPKGGMTLIDQAQSEKLFAATGVIKQQSGGSAANTIAGLAALGGKTAYIGKVADDALGRIFRHDMQAIGVDFDTKLGAPDQPPTAHCRIFITPDGERTMATYLGVSTELAPDDLDAHKIRQAEITYLEGYLFDKEMAKEAFNAAAIMAHTAGKQVALTLSDSFCVHRHRADFQQLINGHTDILFCNDQELLALYETDDIDSAISRIADNAAICAITQGAKGATVIFHGKKFIVPAQPVAKVVDSTGAGDLFAAGFLYGLTKKMDPVQCGQLGAKAAARIIQQVGARSQEDLKELLAA